MFVREGNLATFAAAPGTSNLVSILAAMLSAVIAGDAVERNALIL
jgi:hypothetical protein